MHFHKPQEKPSRWGSFADVQYAIRVNSEKIYGCNPDDDVLVMPLFWGLPPLDYSGYNNHGTNHGATYKAGSLNFDGGNDYVDCGSFQDLGNTFTFATWIKTTDSGGYKGIIVEDGATYYNAALRISFGKAQFRQYGATTVETPEDYNDGNWHFAVGVSKNKALKLYIDGNLEGSDTAVNDFVWNANLRIAKYGGYYYGGSIDEVRISNTARSADQIALFNDNKYGLYQKVGRPIWSIPAAGVTIPIFMQNMRGSFNSPGTRGGFIN